MSDQMVPEGTGPAELASAAQQVLEFVRLSERLKCELRHSWLSSGRRESVAEHSWQMALMAMLVSSRLACPIDVCRVLKIILVHDLVEAEVGDVPFTEVSRRKELKTPHERAAISHIRSLLDPVLGNEIYSLWMEYEEAISNEAKLAKALDNLEVQIQHNLASLKTWEPEEYLLVYTKMDRYCAHDPFLLTLCETVKADAERKWSEAGVDPNAVRANVTSGSVSAVAEALPSSVATSRKGRRPQQRPGRLSHGQVELFSQADVPSDRQKVMR
jgi:putative hydrolases of HD superfamily